MEILPLEMYREQYGEYAYWSKGGKGECKSFIVSGWHGLAVKTFFLVQPLRQNVLYCVIVNL